MFGRRILTATFSPLWSMAKWTCATEALATGFSLNSLNTDEIFFE